MSTDYFSDLAITETIREEFSKKLDITRMIVRDVQVGPVAHASVFRVKGGTIYVLIRSANPATLGDIRKMMLGMGTEPDGFVPPSDVEEYFTNHAIDKYKAVFPGKRIQNDAEELRYYRTLVPYNPALVRVARIRGEIREYEPKTRQWSVVKQLTYSKIQTTE